MESAKICKELKNFDQIEEHRGTFYYDIEGNQLGSELGVVCIPLYKGMKMTISEHEYVYRVVDWNYHLGYKFEEAGLRIILEATNEPVTNS